jgi:hypothetical protein
VPSGQQENPRGFLPLLVIVDTLVNAALTWVVEMNDMTVSRGLNGNAFFVPECAAK